MEKTEMEQIAKELLEYCKTYQRLAEIEILRSKKVKEQRYKEAASLLDEKKLLKLKLPSEERIMQITKLMKL